MYKLVLAALRARIGFGKAIGSSPAYLLDLLSVKATEHRRIQPVEQPAVAQRAVVVLGSLPDSHRRPFHQPWPLRHVVRTRADNPRRVGSCARQLRVRGGGVGGSVGLVRRFVGRSPLAARTRYVFVRRRNLRPPEYSAEALRPSNTESSDSSGFRTSARSRLLLRRRRLPRSLPPSLDDSDEPPPPPRDTSPWVRARLAAILAAWRLLASAFRSARVSWARSWPSPGSTESSEVPAERRALMVGTPASLRPTSNLNLHKSAF